ncbi:MAG: hypothetical protein CMM50_12765 [Rhodospirillaceae bacterium]|jgi:hypothetical protein|nr:hypothetical protein [Rhodospirillaceae bacterium]|tara:strand:+ start:1200 stop:1499 length:300 start_codon:yes stop_codon:yes gene_type:complete
MRNSVIATLVAGVLSAGMIAGAQASPPQRVDAYMGQPAFNSGASVQTVEEAALGGRQVSTNRGYWRPQAVVAEPQSEKGRSVHVPSFGRVPQGPYGRIG